MICQTSASPHRRPLPERYPQHRPYTSAPWRTCIGHYFEFCLTAPAILVTLPVKFNVAEKILKRGFGYDPSNIAIPPTDPENNTKKRKTLAQRTLAFGSGAELLIGSSVPETSLPSPVKSIDPPLLVQVLPLIIMSVSAADVATFIRSLETGTSNSRPKNQNLPLMRRSCTDEDLKFTQELPRSGHCQYLVGRKLVKGAVVESLKLSEGGSNNDSPRVSAFPGLPPDTKVYVYHAIALHKAFTSPDENINLELLATVTRSKQEPNPRTILHLCGHKWCVNAEHLRVGSKTLNDEQSSCHRGLQASSSAEDMAGVTRFFCRHEEKCWTIAYKGSFEDLSVWSAD